MKKFHVLAALGFLAALAPLAAQAESAHPSFQVTVTGHGRNIILIPGLSSSGAVWDSTVAHLQGHYTCHVLTLAGFAGVPRLADGPFLETVRNQIGAYIRTQNLDHPILIGHSLGGFLALWLASQEPELTGPLVIVDSLPFLPAIYNPAATAENMQAMAKQTRDTLAAGGPAFQKQNEAAVKSMVTGPANFKLVDSWANASDPVAAGDAIYDMFTHDLRSDVARIAVPTLVLGTWIAYRQNDQDTATRTQVEKNFETQYAQLKGVKIVLADHARHFIMLDDATWFFSQLDAFLAGPAATKPSSGK